MVRTVASLYRARYKRRGPILRRRRGRRFYRGRMKLYKRLRFGEYFTRRKIVVSNSAIYSTVNNNVWLTCYAYNLGTAATNNICTMNGTPEYDAMVALYKLYRVR